MYRVSYRSLYQQAAIPTGLILSSSQICLLNVAENNLTAPCQSTLLGLFVTWFMSRRVLKQILGLKAFTTGSGVKVGDDAWPLDNGVFLGNNGHRGLVGIFHQVWGRLTLFAQGLIDGASIVALSPSDSRAALPDTAWDIRDMETSPTLIVQSIWPASAQGQTA